MADDVAFRAWRMAVALQDPNDTTEERTAWFESARSFAAKSLEDNPTVAESPGANSVRGLLWVDALAGPVSVGHLGVARLALTEERAAGQAGADPDDDDACALLAAALARWTRERLQPAMRATRKAARPGAVVMTHPSSFRLSYDPNAPPGRAGERVPVFIGPGHPAVSICAPLCALDGMLWADAALANALDLTGGRGRKTGDSLRTDAVRRWTEAAPHVPERGHVYPSTEPLSALWRQWRDEPPAPRWCLLAARVLWVDEVWAKLCDQRAAKESARTPVPLAVVGGRDWHKVPSAIGAAAWGLGGEGRRVEVDGREFAEAPGVTVYVSRAAGVVPSGRYVQGPLPLGLEDDEPRVALVSRAMGDVHACIGRRAARLALYLSATAPADGYAKMTLRDLATAVRGDGKRVRAEELRDTLEDLRGLSPLRLLLERVAVQLWSVEVVPRVPDPELPVVYRWSGAMGALIQGSHGSSSKVRAGGFLLDLTGAMELDGRSIVALRLYVAVADVWNRSRDPRNGFAWQGDDAVPALALDEWGALANALSDAAMGEGAGAARKFKVRRYEDRTRVRAAFEELLRLRLVGQLCDLPGGRLRPLPPAELHEAWRRARGLERAEAAELPH